MTRLLISLTVFLDCSAMKSILLAFIVFFSSAVSHGQSSGMADSLPPCINHITYMDPTTFTEYEYKGQHWFSFTTRASVPKEKTSDHLTTINFYDLNCHLVGSWKKGGIAGLNQIKPDSIEKEKIIMIRSRVVDSVALERAKKYWQLPDSIIRLGFSKNSKEIREYVYQSKKLYHLQLTDPLPADGSITIDHPYYDGNGKVILINKKAIRPMYTRAEKWVPATVKNSDVKPIPGAIWNRKGNNYIRQTIFTKK